MVSGPIPNRSLFGLALLLLALGLWQLGGAAVIHGKAWLAQRLLERAWAVTLAGGGPVKPWPWADTWPVARLKVPALDVDLFVLAGAAIFLLPRQFHVLAVEARGDEMSTARWGLPLWPPCRA